MTNDQAIIAAFQTAAGITVDGIPGPQTQETWKAVCAAALTPAAAPAAPPAPPVPSLLLSLPTPGPPITGGAIQIGHVFKNGGTLTVFSQNAITITGSQVDIDADGANGQFGQPPAYAPVGWGPTLDNLGDAGNPGDWWALATDNGQPSGNPIVQGPLDPCPGAYVSQTSLHLLNPDGTQMPASNPMRYVDAATVPFLVICPELRDAVDPIVFGCLAILTNTQTGATCAAVVADGGNYNEMGEISQAAAEALGIPGNARGVGTSANLLTMQIFPGLAAVVNGVTYPLQ
jgi:hypothetical protein